MSARVAAMSESGRTYRAPNGMVFTHADKFRDYMVANFYSFRKRSNEKLVKFPGDLAGQPFEISQLENCTVLILDVTSQVNISGIKNSRVFITPCAGAVFISNAVNCLFTIASSQLRMSYSEDCVVNAQVQNPPSIEMSREITFGPFNGLHSLIKQQYRAALLDERVDRTQDVVDFSFTAVEDLGPLPHWKKLDCTDWSLDLNEDEDTKNLSAAARLAVANLMDRFDADGDGALDYAELNAFQAATGDSDRVADAIEMEQMFEAANIPLDPTGKLRFWSLVQLYAMQGKDALIRDIVAVGARDILPGKLPSWVVKVPPGFTSTAAPQVAASTAELNVSAEHVTVGKAVTLVQVTSRLPMPAIPPTPPRLPPLPALASTRVSSASRSKSPDDAALPAATLRKSLNETFTVRLLEQALKEMPAHTATCFDRQKDPLSSTLSLHDFIRCCTALHIVVGGTGTIAGDIVEDEITKDVPVLQQHNCASVGEEVRVFFQKLLQAARPRRLVRPPTMDSPRTDPNACGTPTLEQVPKMPESRPPRPQTPSVSSKVPAGKAVSPQEKASSRSPRPLSNALEQSLSSALNKSALDRIGKMLHDGSGPFVAGVRRGSTSTSVASLSTFKEHGLHEDAETAAAFVASGTVGRLLTAKKAGSSLTSSKDQKRAKEHQRLRLLNRGDVEGLCDMLLEDLKALVSASSDRFVRLLRGVAASSAQTVEQADGAEPSTVGEVIVVSTVMRLLEDVEIRYPLPVVALVLLKIGGFLLVTPELQCMFDNTSASGPPVDDEQLQSLCDYHRAMISKKMLASYLQGVRAEILSAKALPASTWSSKKEVEAQAENARCLKLFRSALANAVRGVPLATSRSWLNETQVHSFVSQFEIVPDVWIECEARANAKEYLHSSAGKAAIATVTAADGCSSAEATVKIREQHTSNLIDTYTSSALQSEKLFWSYVKDVRSKRWPASFDRDALPSSSGCETYPEGFESWLQWREAHRRLKEARLKEWERVKRSQLIAQQVAKGSMAPIAAIERTIKSLARRAQSAQSEGSAVTFKGMDATNSHGPVKAMHPSRDGMLVEARLARLRDKAVPPPREIVSALATVAGIMPSEDDEHHTDDEGRSIATPSVVGSLPSTNRLSATVPGPAGKVVSLFDFQQEFGGVLFSLQADPVVGLQAKRLADPAGLARAKLEQVLQDETEEGDRMRSRLHAWEEEHATRVGLQQGIELSAQQLQERAFASLILELVAEEAVSTSMQFSPSQDDVIAAAVSSEFQRRRKAQLHFAAWVGKKEEQRRAAAARSSRQLNAKAIETQNRRAKSASAYASWLSSAKKRKTQGDLPSSYAHDGLYADVTAIMTQSPASYTASPESKSARVDPSVNSPAGGASLNSSHVDIQGAKRLNFSVSDVSFQSVARRDGSQLSNVQRFHGPIATQSSPRVDLGDGSFHRSPVSAAKGKVQAGRPHSLPASQRRAHAVPPRVPTRKSTTAAATTKKNTPTIRH